MFKNEFGEKQEPGLAEVRTTAKKGILLQDIQQECGSAYHSCAGCKGGFSQP